MAKKTKAELEREIASLRGQVELLKAINDKLLDAMKYAATTPCPQPVIIGPTVNPQPFIAPVQPLRVEPYWVGDAPPNMRPQFWCEGPLTVLECISHNTTGCATVPQ